MFGIAVNRFIKWLNVFTGTGLRVQCLTNKYALIRCRFTMFSLSASTCDQTKQQQDNPAVLKSYLKHMCVVTCRLAVCGVTSICLLDMHAVTHGATQKKFGGWHVQWQPIIRCYARDELQNVNGRCGEPGFRYFPSCFFSDWLWLTSLELAVLKREEGMSFFFGGGGGVLLLFRPSAIAHTNPLKTPLPSPNCCWHSQVCKWDTLDGLHFNQKKRPLFLYVGPELLVPAGQILFLLANGNANAQADIL